MKTTKLVINVKGGIIQSIHSNNPIQYIVVDNDLNSEDGRISEVLTEDATFSDYFDIFDTNDNNFIMSKFLEAKEDIDNVQPEYNELEAAMQTIRKYGYIRHIWNKSDILLQAKRMDITLTDEQLNKVYNQLEKTDSELGINWDQISIVIDNVIESE